MFTTEDLSLILYSHEYVFDIEKQQLYFITNTPRITNKTIISLGLPSKEQLDSLSSSLDIHFKLKSDLKTAFERKDYIKSVEKARQYCKEGDLFQVVLSRLFYQSYCGYPICIYNQLRKVDPLTYHFYLKTPTYALLGVSPEAQLTITKNKAYITPLAGTCKRTGNKEIDQKNINFLKQDQKENSEHIMLVDLARNDLNHYGNRAKVEYYKQIYTFENVFHLASCVSTQLDKNADIMQIFAHTFPAGTLSGAPKYRAIERIDILEPTYRGWYGGSIGYFGFDHSLVTAIIIRSMLCQNNTIYIQAGGGIVVDSCPEKEEKEIRNKLSTLFKALESAHQNN